MKLRYKISSASTDANARIAVRLRRTGSDWIHVDLTKTWAQLRKVAGGVYTQLDSDANADSNLDTVYQTQIIMDGKHVEVWWGPEGGDLSLILETSVAPILTGTQVDFVSYANTVAYWDDIDFRTEDPSMTVFAYNTANELTKTTESGVDTTFTYDAWGRTVSKQQTVGQTTFGASYGYRFGDKLKWVSTNFPGEQSVEFNYDGLGKRRVKLVNDTDGTWYRWDAGWGMLAEYGGDGSWTVGTREMSYLEGMAQVPGDDPSSGTYAVFGKDHLESTRSLFSGSKVETARLDYMPYGEERIAAGDVPAKRYTGHTWDAETGLYFAPYRYYSPTASRWLTRDPLGMVDGPNVYWYALGSPTVMLDTFGLGAVTALVCGILCIFDWSCPDSCKETDPTGLGVACDAGENACKRACRVPGVLNPLLGACNPEIARGMLNCATHRGSIDIIIENPENGDIIY